MYVPVLPGAVIAIAFGCAKAAPKVLTRFILFFLRK